MLIISIDWEEFLITMPRMPESEIKTLLPLPRTVIFGLANEFLQSSLPSGSCDDWIFRCGLKNCLLRPLIKFKILINSSLEMVWMNKSAGPPMLTVVYGARGWFRYALRVGKAVVRRW